MKAAAALSLVRFDSTQPPIVSLSESSGCSPRRVDLFRGISATRWRLHPERDNETIACSSTAGRDVEIAMSQMHPHFVSTTLSARVWVYAKVQVATNRRPRIVHYKCLVRDVSSHSPVRLTRATLPASRVGFQIYRERTIRRRWQHLRLDAAKRDSTETWGSRPALPSGLTRGQNRRYYYVGGLRQRIQNGWGRMSDSNRLVLEGTFVRGLSSGWYAAFHEFFAEFGLHTSHVKIGVFVLGDAEASVIPFAFDVDPMTGELLPPPPDANMALKTVVTSGGNRVVWFGGSLAELELEPWSSPVYRAPSSELCSSSEACSFTSRTTAERMNSASSPAVRLSSSSDAESRDDFRAEANCVISQFVAEEESKHFCLRGRRRSHPELLALPVCRRTSVADFSSVMSPGPWECPEHTGASVERHLRVVCAAPFWFRSRLRACECLQWTCDNVCLFLSALGAYRAAQGLKERRVDGAQLPFLSLAFLITAGCDVYCARFVLTVFRHLINTVDPCGLLHPHRLTKCNPMPRLDDTPIVLHRKIGNGGHAVVFKGTVGSQDAALKIFASRRHKKRGPLAYANAAAMTPKADSASRENKRPSFLSSALHQAGHWLNRSWPTAKLKEALPAITVECAPPSTPPKLTTIRSLYHTPAVCKMRDYEIYVMECLPPHPNILRAFGHFELEPGLPGFAMEHSPAGCMHSSIFPTARSRPQKPTRTYAWTELIHIFGELALGMAHMHEHGFLHRDLKPSNFLSGIDGHAKICDFGMAVRYKPNVSPYCLAAYGNMYYAAPEVLRGEGFWPESDVFSFGVSMWEALTGCGAHEGLNKGQVFCRVAGGGFEFPSPICLNVEIAKFLNRMLSSERSERPLFSEIHEFLDSAKHLAEETTMSYVNSFFQLT